MARDTRKNDEGRPSRRSMLKGLLVGLGAGVLVQATGGVAFADQPKMEKRKVDRQKVEKVEKPKVDKQDKQDKSRTSKETGRRGGNERRKTEEPKQQ